MANSSWYTKGFHLKLNEGTGTPADSAGSKTVTVGSAISNLWSNSGWASAVTSSGAGTPDASGGFYVDQPDWNMNDGDSLILAFWMKAPAPNDKIIGTRFRSTESGFYIVNSGSQHLLSLVIENTNGDAISGRLTQRGVFDDSPHHVCIAIDGATKRLFLFVDGLPQRDVDLDFDLSSLDGYDTKNDNAGLLGFGIAGDGGGDEKSYASQYRDIQCLVGEGVGLPFNITDVVKYMLTNPYQTLQDSLLGA